MLINNKKMKYFIVLLLVAASQCLVVKQKSCDGSGEVLDVKVTPCDKEPCILKKGGTSTVKINFKPSKAADNLKYVIEGYVGNKWTSYKSGEACKFLSKDCPLEAGKEYEFSKPMEVSEDYPTTDVVVKLELKDENEKNVVCVKVPVRLE